MMSSKLPGVGIGIGGMALGIGGPEVAAVVGERFRDSVMSPLEFEIIQLRYAV